MAKIKTLKAQFGAADGERTSFLVRARECARLTHPSILPPIGTIQANELPSSYQGLAGDGLSNVVSKLMFTVFQPPWYRFRASAKMRSDPGITQADIEEFKTYLYARELLIQAQFETTKLSTKFRTSFEHTLAVGNSATLCGGEDGDYWYQNFRLDNYVQRLSSGGKLLWGITREQKDPTELSDVDISKAGLGSREELEEKEGDERNQELYTKWTRRIDGEKTTWLIQQEMNDKIIRESEESVNPYLTLGYVQLSGENWARGFVEEKLPWLRTFDTHHRSLLDWGTAISKLLMFVDPSQSFGVTPKDLSGPSGQILLGRVKDGIVQGVAFLTSKMSADVSVLRQMTFDIGSLLGKQFLLETEAQRQAERVTATEVMRVAKQLEGALGAIYAEIASDIQRPLLDRMIYQMERDMRLPPIPERLKGAVDVEILTGLEALGRQVELEKVVGALQLISTMPAIIDRISPERLMKVIFRGYNIDMEELAKTADEMEEEEIARQAREFQAAAAQQAIETTGAVVQEAAKQETAAAGSAA